MTGIRLIPNLDDRATRICSKVEIVLKLFFDWCCMA